MTAERTVVPRSGQAAMPVLRCENASHTYGSGSTAVVAVRNVSCDILPGSRIALMGPSGSGKSTLLHMLAGLEQATSGTVSWLNVDGDPIARPGSIGVIFQGPSLIPTLDVVENVALPLVLQGVPDAEARILALAALEQLQLGGMASKVPDELSGGQAQRVAIARTLATRPALIFADEPTGQLDHETGRHVIDTLIQAADRLSAALVISTHDPVVADRLPVQWRIHDGVLSTADTSSHSTGGRP